MSKQEGVMKFLQTMGVFIFVWLVFVNFTAVGIAAESYFSYKSTYSSPGEVFRLPCSKYGHSEPTKDDEITVHRKKDGVIIDFGKLLVRCRSEEPVGPLPASKN